MKLVIERSGGFDIIESADVERIEVENHGVRIYMTDGTDTFAERAGHAESVATAAAIAAKCGTLVEPLSEGPEVDGEDVMRDATAALVRKNSKPWRPASEWVDGEPPKDGRWYVVRWAHGVLSFARWDDDASGWMGANGKACHGPMAHAPMPIPER